MKKIENLKQYLGSLMNESAIGGQAIVPAPGCLPSPCFPDIIEKILEVVTEREWEELTDRARNYLKWISVKAESIDALAPRPFKESTRGFELLAIDRDLNSFGEIVERSHELGIPSFLVRFASLISTFLTVRLLSQHMEYDQDLIPSLKFSQNVDSNYLNYPRTLKTLLGLFPEYKEMFFFEINEEVSKLLD